MIEEVISNIVNTTIASFDFPYCVIVNILTYITIKFINARNPRLLGTWNKRLVFFIVSVLVAIVYCSNGSDYKIIFNSIILAPVSWSWIFKPICNKLNIGYKLDKELNDIL
jgi:hypothetical protein